VASAGSLRRRACCVPDFDAHVYEQTSKLGEVGAGINIGPNASRILHRLGIAEAALSRRASISGAGMTVAFCSALR